MFLTESKLVAFWNLIGDADKQIFANDKFLAQASNDGEYLYCWTLTGLLDSEKTFLWGNFFNILIVITIIIIRAFVRCTMSASELNLRRRQSLGGEDG